jgi:hypothetical protein
VSGPYKRKAKLVIDENAWKHDDLIILGSTRWIIRVIDHVTGHVELEASNAAAGIWWRTTLDRLPQKVSKK